MNELKLVMSLVCTGLSLTACTPPTDSDDARHDPQLTIQASSISVQDGYVTIEGEREAGGDVQLHMLRESVHFRDPDGEPIELPSQVTPSTPGQPRIGLAIDALTARLCGTCICTPSACDCAIWEC